MHHQHAADNLHPLASRQPSGKKGGEQTVRESIDILLQSWAIWIHSQALHPCLQQIVIMNTLSPREDFLPIDDDVVGVAVVWILGAGHGVEGSTGCGIAFEDEYVGVVFRTD